MKEFPHSSFSIVFFFIVGTSNGPVSIRWRRIFAEFDWILIGSSGFVLRRFLPSFYGRFRLFITITQFYDRFCEVYLVVSSLDGLYLLASGVTGFFFYRIGLEFSGKSIINRLVFRLIRFTMITQFYDRFYEVYLVLLSFHGPYRLEREELLGFTEFFSRIILVFRPLLVVKCYYNDDLVLSLVLWALPA